MILHSKLGAGSFLSRHFSMLVNSILFSFGLSEEMHNPVSIFALLGIVVAGATLGYWMVRKFVIAEDGSVDVGIAQFVKWAMCVIAATFIFQVAIVFMLIRVLLILLWQWGHWLLVYQSAFLSLSSSGVVQIKLLAPFFPYSPLASCWRTVLPLLFGIQFILQMGILGGVEGEQM